MPERCSCPSSRLPRIPACVGSKWAGSGTQPTDAEEACTRTFRIYRCEPRSRRPARGMDRYTVDLASLRADGARTPSSRSRPRSIRNASPSAAPAGARASGRLLRHEHRRRPTPSPASKRDRRWQQKQITIYPLPHMPVIKDHPTSRILRAICLDPPPVDPHCRALRLRIGNASSQGGSGQVGRAFTNASSAHAARLPVRAIGGTATDTSDRRFCCRPIVGSWTRGTKTPAPVWTSSRIPSGSTAVTRS